MPTVIDSLIVSLSLDPSGFTEGQRKAADSIRQMETAANRSGKNIEDSVGHGVVSFFRSLEAPFQAARRQFEQLAVSTAPTGNAQQNLVSLGTQARRTGESVESGALAGAAGLRVLGFAGVVALGTIAALNKGISGLTGVARGVFSQGIGAQASGLPIGGFTAISQALYRSQNVPQEDTQNFLSNLGQLLTGVKQGRPEDIQEFAQLQVPFALAGVPLDLNASPEETLNRLALSFSKLTPAERIRAGVAVGMSPTMAAGVGAAGAGLPASIAAAQRTAVTDQDKSASDELIAAQNKLDTSWQKLTRTIALDLDPAITNLFTGLDTLLSGKEDWSKDFFDLTGIGPLSRLASKLGSSSPIDAALDVIAQHESGNRNVPNYRYDATHTASGYYQITDTNWRAYGKGIVDLSKYPHAIDAPKELQAQVAARMYREQGVGPWSSASGGSIGSISQFNAEVAADQTRMLQSAKAGNAGNVSSTSSNTINIGDVNVHGVDQNNGPAVGGAIHDTLTDKMGALFSNTGLQ